MGIEQNIAYGAAGNSQTCFAQIAKPETLLKQYIVWSVGRNDNYCIYNGAMSTNARCPKCQVEISKDLYFCGECGEFVNQEVFKL